MVDAYQSPRAREVGLPFSGLTGAHNAITDVPGVEVGHVTLVRGDGALVTGSGPVRTGVTVVLPRGRSQALVPLRAGVHALNGNGEMTGTHWVEEAGIFRGPIAVTNTHAVGIAHHALVRWMVRNGGDRGPYPWLLPVVAETCDQWLNDMDGLHVREQHVLDAIDAARPGPVAEGNVGGGTGMICYGFKGGIGTSSRLAGVGGRDYCVGALVQANMGVRPALNIMGVPVGRHMPVSTPRPPREQGSIIVVVATDAPLLPGQAKRLARRAGLGVGRTGTASGDGSGDIFLAFSTAPEASPDAQGLCHASFLPHHHLDPLFEAVVDAVEESIVNALVAARTMVGRDDHRVEAIDAAQLSSLVRAAHPARP
ncbi:MAG TPA: P1 family peptidase [Ramlibacter sp.]|nr:P1 family peptidase [Ramlibacter sp.]